MSLIQRRTVADVKAEIVQADKARDAAARDSNLGAYRVAQTRLDALLDELHAMLPRQR